MADQFWKSATVRAAIRWGCVGVASLALAWGQSVGSRLGAVEAKQAAQEASNAAILRELEAIHADVRAMRGGK
jgi:hypothetical protein